MKQLTRAFRTAVWTALIVFGCAALASGGEFYLSDEPAYWWYWDGTPDYEVLIPASPPNAASSAQFSYVQVSFAGQTSLVVSLGASGPLLLIGTLPQTNPDAVFDALVAPWRAALRQSRKSTDTTIQTEQGLRADFMVLEGTGPNGRAAMVRLVTFRRGERMAYLLFAGDASSYAGDIRQYWLRAVNSFRWR